MINIPPFGLLKSKSSIPRAGIGAYANIYRPASSADWAQMNALFGTLTPKWQYNCQEAAGNLEPTITPGGGAALNPSGTVSYQQTVTDWTSKWVEHAYGEANCFQTPNLYNMNANSVFWLFYSTLQATVAATAGYSDLNTSGSGMILQQTTPGAGNKLRVGNVSGAFSPYSTGEAFPFAVMYDKRGGGYIAVSTNKELIVGTYVNPANASKALGRTVGISTNSRHNLWAIWEGVDAETMMDRGGSHLGAKTLIQNLQWPMAY